MSDHIPFHIQAEIMKRLPVKSLIRFTCVSKAWKSLIENSEFIANHIFRPQHMLVTFKDQKIVSFVDEDTFPDQGLVPTLPRSVHQHSRIVGSSQGLLCFNAFTDSNQPNLGYIRRTYMTVIWNPSIRKSIVRNVSIELYENDETVLGFGVCPLTYDPMIMVITQFHKWPVKVGFTGLWDVKVYRLSSAKWKSLSRNLPSKSVRVQCPQVIVDRFIYWCAEQRLTIDNGLRRFHNVVMSFDMTNDSFKVVDLPKSLACHPLKDLSISKLKESLAILEYNINTGVYDVWMMDVERSFAKMFNITAPHGSIMGFLKSGEPIMDVKVDDASELVVCKTYTRCSDHFTDLEFSRTSDMMSVNSYVETLLFLGRCDCNDY
ncbi:hypothetical protein Lser_V15G22865 [Lactuca serriola]